MYRPKVYAVSVAAVDVPSMPADNIPTKINLRHTALVCVAESEEEAHGFAMQIVESLFPPTLGYRNHSAHVMLVGRASRNQKRGMKL